MARTGRMTNTEKDHLKSQAKELFIKGFTVASISDIIGVGQKTLQNWRKLDEWDHLKDLNNIRPSEIKLMILQVVSDLKEGKKPTYTADAVAKIAAAFDKLNDSRKKAVHTMEAFNDFMNFKLEVIATMPPKERDTELEAVKKLRIDFDKYVNRLLEND